MGHDEILVATAMTPGGGRGDDLLVGGYGDDVAFGGIGEDALLDFLTVAAEMGEDDDVFRGGPNRDVFETYYGADRFYGGADTDRFFFDYHPGLGSSVMYGQDGGDNFIFRDSGVDPGGSCVLSGVTIRLFGH